MGIFSELKRMYLRYKNSDPYYSCEYFKENWCNMVDGQYCHFPNCDIRLKHLGYNFTSCSDCTKNDYCTDTNYGKGCFNGNKCKECENGKN